MRNKARASLQETSKNRVKNWSNTLEATRIKREQDRIKRLEDAEVSLYNIENNCDNMMTFIDGSQKS